jgi:hypothetical protein
VERATFQQSVASLQAMLRCMMRYALRFVLRCVDVDAARRTVDSLLFLQQSMLRGAHNVHCALPLHVAAEDL